MTPAVICILKEALCWFRLESPTTRLYIFSLVVKISGPIKMSRWVLNSVIISVIPTITGVFLDALLGYIFAKKRFPGRQLIFWYFMAAIMVPYQATIVKHSRIHIT